MQALQNRQANFHLNHLNPQASAQTQARIAQAQAQARARARAVQQQQANQGQPGDQQNQQMNGQRLIGAQPRQSPTSLLTQPVEPPGHRIKDPLKPIVCIMSCLFWSAAEGSVTCTCSARELTGHLGSATVVCGICLHRAAKFPA